MPWKERLTQRSCVCAPDLLVYLRERKGWTQKELAKAAGYSERLVNKAEAGQPISLEAIDHLAEALGDGDKPIYPEDLITDPIKHAKEYIAALYTKGMEIVDAIEHFLDEEVVFQIAGDPKNVPFAGVYRGIPALREGFRLFYSVLEAPKNHNYQEHYTFVGQGNEVIMTGESWIHPIGMPLEQPIRIAHRYVFRRGKLVLLEDVYDTLAGKQSLEREF